ncbi:hypothetical protein D3C71_1585760 [compost metagenome]
MDHLASSRDNKWEQVGLGVYADDGEFDRVSLVVGHVSIMGTEAKDTFSTSSGAENSFCGGWLDR